MITGFASERENVTAEDAFWAYDDGRIGYEELESLLQWIDAGEDSEACAEWEALGQDPCKKTLFDLLQNSNAHGNVGYGISYDSSGNIRNQKAQGKLQFGMFRGSFRLKSKKTEGWHVENLRISLTGKSFAAVAGNLSSADVGSAIALQKNWGGLLQGKFDLLRMGTFALKDSTAGIFAETGSQKKIQFLGMGTASLDGFQDAFFRMRGGASDLQVMYSKDWKTPLLYVSAKSPKSTILGGSYPLDFRFRAYIHENDSLFGIFRLPKLLQKNRAFASSTVQMQVENWNFRLHDRFRVPLDSGTARSSAEISFVRNRKLASVGGGMLLNAVGDSLSVQMNGRAGIQLFYAESLFTEKRLILQDSFEKISYEIRPGIRLEWEKNVYSDWTLILRGPQKKPIALRQETHMHFSRKWNGKSSLELRAKHLRQMHFWRFGLEFQGTW